MWSKCIPSISVWICNKKGLEWFFSALVWNLLHFTNTLPAEPYPALYKQLWTNRVHHSEQLSDSLSTRSQFQELKEDSVCVFVSRKRSLSSWKLIFRSSTFVFKEGRRNSGLQLKVLCLYLFLMKVLLYRHQRWWLIRKKKPKPKKTKLTLRVGFIRHIY